MARHHPRPLVYYRVVCCVMKVSRRARFSYGCAVARSARPRSAQSSPSSARARPNFSALSCNTKYVDITYHSFCRGSCCRFYLSERDRGREHERERAPGKNKNNTAAPRRSSFLLPRNKLTDYFLTRRNAAATPPILLRVSIGN